MESTTHHEPSHMSPALGALPEDRTQWPRDAGHAYDHLLRELNRWSRENRWPHSNNSWIAEEAVRRGW